MNSRDLVPVAGAGGGGGKGGGGGSRSPVEAPDSLRSVQYARVINLLCEGEIEGIVGNAAGIYVDDTPLANADGSWNFNGAAIEWRTGTATQTPISGFSATESESTVGVTVTAAAPVTRSITNPNVTAIRVTLGFPQMTSLDTTTGDLGGTSVQLAIDVQRNGAGFQTFYTDTVTGKTTSRYQRSYRLGLSRFGVVGGTYDIRVRRITPDSTSSNLQNAFQWETMTEIVDSQLMYPYCALVGVQIDASTFKSIPKLSFDTQLRRVQIPSNYDPLTRTYTGVWDGTFKVAWSDNPAWIVYDLAVTQRFGLGAYLSPALIDKWTLYSIGQYCDGMVNNGFGQLEPRYTCNCYIQERADAITLLQHFASIFNGLIFWSGGALTFSADMPADPVDEFSPSKIIDGAFNYVGSPLNQRHTTALVTWNDPAQKYAQAIEYVEDAEAIAQWGIRELQIQAFGCTSRGQAHRVGRWALLTERYLSESVTFKTGINAAFVRPGDVFLTTDPTRAGARMGGRVLDGGTDWLTLDASVDLTTDTSWSISVMLPDGTFATRTLLVTQDGPQATVHLAQALPVAATRMCAWAISGGTLQMEQWRCTSASEDEDGNIEIAGIAYRPDKFAAIEVGLKLEPLPISIIDPFNVGPCTELDVTESKYLISPMVVGSRATFSWLAPVGAVRFAVSYQHEQDSPVYADCFMNSIDVQPTEEGTWYFTVWAINSIGVRSAPASITVQLRALNQPPEDVKGFQLTVINDSADLGWIASTDLDVVVGGHVAIRFSTRLTTAVLWEEASDIVRFSGSQSSGYTLLMKGTYLAKFINSSGAYSENPAYVISTTGPLRDYNLVANLQQDPTFTGVKQNMIVRNGILFLDQDPDTGLVVSTQGGYYFDRVVDMGKVYTVRCSTYNEGAVYDVTDDVDTWPDFDARPDVDGTKINEGGSLVLASITNVDPNVAQAADWSPWTRLVVADLTFRAVRFSLAVKVPDTTHGIGITSLGAIVDVPDRIESRNNVPVAAAGSLITFSVPFKAAPAISIIAQGLASGDKWSITNQSATGFTIQFQNSGGTGIAKTCDWIARGYGYEHVDLDGLGWSALMRGDIERLLADRQRMGVTP
jgi:predicted phage tail protein